MAKVYTGRDAQLLLGSDVQLKVTSWSLSASLDMHETTTLGDSLRSFVPGVVSYSGNATLLYYKTDTGTNDAGTLLKKIIKTGTDGIAASETATLKLRLVDGTDVNDVELTTYINSASFAANPGDTVKAQIGFVATGALSTASI